MENRFTCIGKGHSAPALPATRKEWEELRKQPWLADMCRRIEQGDEKLKGRLPIWTPACAEFRENHRAIKDAVKPLRRAVMDVDEKGHSQEILLRLQPLMTEGRWEVLLVEESVRRGTHIILSIPQGMSIEEVQKRFSNDIGYQVDSSTKDVSRCLYMVPDDHTLYVSEKLFSEERTDSDKRTVISDKRLVDDTNQSTLNANHSNTFPTTYKGVSYADILKAIADELGGEPEEGERNAKVLRMASSLRHICDNNAEWLMEIIPTYGLPEEEWKKTIQNACKDGLKYGTTKVLNNALEKLNVKSERLSDESELTANHSTISTPPIMPQKLPPLVKLLTKNVPDDMKAAVAHAIFPALGAHLNGVRFRYIDNVEHEATFMCVLLAKQSSGKSAVNKPIEYILADIRERDAYNREREQAWKDSLNSKGSNKEKPKRPDDLCIQILSADMTNAAFVQRLADAKGKFLYTQMDEIELLDQLKTSGKGNNVSQIIRLAFDCGLYGQERVGSQSVTAQVRLRWNWNASSTIQNGKKYFCRLLTNGTLSRVNFCTIHPNVSNEMPVYGTYDEDFAAQLKPFIDRLNRTTGLVECDNAEKLAKLLAKENAEIAALSDDEAYETLSRRANVIAYLKAMTLYIAEGKWTKEIEEFIRWSEEYDLWCKMHFFGEALNKEIDKEYITVHRGPRSLLADLPDSFTKQQLVEVMKRHGKNSPPSKLLSNWKRRGYIHLEETDYYVKVINNN